MQDDRLLGHPFNSLGGCVCVHTGAERPSLTTELQLPFCSSYAALRASFHSSSFFAFCICSTVAHNCSIAIPACSMVMMVATHSTSSLSFWHADDYLLVRSLPMPSSTTHSKTSTLARDACSPYKLCMLTPLRNARFAIRPCRPAFCSSGAAFS